MKITLISSTCWPIVGGAEGYVRQLALALRASGHDVVIGTRFDRQRPPDGLAGVHAGWQDAPSARTDGLDVHILRGRTGGRALLAPTHRLHFHGGGKLAQHLTHLALGPSLRAMVRGADVVHIAGTGRELLGLAAADVCDELGVPFVVTPFVHPNSWGDSELDLRLYRRAGAVFTLTRFERDHLVGLGLDPAKVHAVAPGVPDPDPSADGSAFRDRIGVGEAPVVLFVGRKAEYKGADLVRRMAIELAELEPRARVVLAGPDDASLVTPTDGTVSIELGALTDQERDDAMAGCDVLCVPSRDESFGLVYAEAWRFGVPTVGLSIPTVTELFHDSGAGVVVDADPVLLARAVADLLGDRDAYERRAAAGRAWVGQHSWPKTTETMVELYRAAGARGSDEERRDG